MLNMFHSSMRSTFFNGRSSASAEQCRDVARHEVLPRFDEASERRGGFLEFLVLEKLVHEFPTRIHFFVLGVGIDGVLALRQQQPAFDLHQRRRHHEEFACDVEVELLHRVQRIDVLLA